MTKPLSRKNFFMAMASAILLLLAFPGSGSLWPLALGGLVPLFFALREVSTGQAARLGLLTGLTFYTPLLYWIIFVLGKYGELAWWVSVPALLLLALYMSCYLALFAGGLNWFLKRGGPVFLWAAPLLWVALDFSRTHLFSGFPWQDIAYSLYRVPLLIQTADITGHYGVSFNVILTNTLVFALVWRFTELRLDGLRQPAMPGEEIRRGDRFFILPALLVLVTVMTYNFWRYHQVAARTLESPTIKMAVIQGNIDQALKWTPAMREKTVTTYAGLSRKALGDGYPLNTPLLLVWPETALPFYPQTSQLFPALIDSLVRKEKIWLLAGTPFYETKPSVAPGDGRQKTINYFNSAILVSPQGLVLSRYDKQHLVPFGEYVPLGNILPLPGPLVESIGDFSAGSSSEPLTCQKARIGVLICFESIFPELARRQVENGANLLVNLTNDAWFGRSSAPWQHLSMAVFRAVETRKSLARAANTGISGFVDPVGRLGALSPLFEPWQMAADVPLMTGDTLFVRVGHYFGLCCLFGLLPAALLATGKNRRQLREPKPT